MSTPAPCPTDPTLDPRAWAEATFGGCRLGDRRLERRLVRTAAAIAADPAGSLGRALADPAALTGAYRLLHHDRATAAAITAEHRGQTRRAAGAEPGVVLLVQDTTELDYTPHPATAGLGPIGDGRGRGFLVHSVLAVRAADGAVLGLGHLEPFDRVPAPRPDATCAERRGRPRESDCWLRAVAATGRPPAGATWVAVGDRGADMFRLFAACRDAGQAFVIRAAQDRRTADAGALPAGVLRRARALPAGAERREVAVPRRPGQPARTAALAAAWGAVRVRPPTGEPGAPLALWVVRAWEPDPPAGAEAVEWILLTSVATATEAQAWERVGWYRRRWVVEDFHQALKTGCRIEAAQLRDGAALRALLGVCAPVAVRLVQLRTAARADPDAPATDALDPQAVAVVAALTGTEAAGMTAGACFRLIARLGGHQGRKGDGEPGWKSLWWGWQRVAAVLEGVRLAPRLADP